MIGISFGEIIVICIVAILFIKPSEMQHFIHKYLNIFFNIKQKFNSSIEDIKQNIAIDQYNKSLDMIYANITKEPELNFEVHEFSSQSEDLFCELEKSNQDNTSQLEDNYDLFFDHMPKIEKNSRNESNLEKTYAELKKKLRN